MSKQGKILVQVMMKSSEMNKMIRMTHVGSAVAGCNLHNYKVYSHLRNLGINSIVYGFWEGFDREFSFLEFFCRSDIFPEMMPRRIKKNIEELTRRIKLAKKYDLNVYLEIWSPVSMDMISKKVGEKTFPFLKYKNPNFQENKYLYEGAIFAQQHPEYFGKGGDRTQGTPALCTSHPKIREYYRDAISNLFTDFPDVRGIIMWGGDWYAVNCSDDCPRCKGKNRVKRYAEFVNLLYKNSKKVKPEVEFYVHDWPWWDGIFKMEKYLDKKIGFVSSSSWGFQYGKTKEKYPALEKPWKYKHFEFGYKDNLDQPWFIVQENGSRFIKLVNLSKKKKRPIIALASLLVSAEDILPELFPSPITVYERLKRIIKIGAVSGIKEFWGPFRLFDGQVRINEDMFRKYLACRQTGLSNQSITKEKLLTEVARENFGEKAIKESIKTWMIINNALLNWSVVHWAQRIGWSIGQNTNGAYFYGPILDVSNKEQKINLSADRQDLSADRQDLSADRQDKKISDNLSHVINLIDKALIHANKIIMFCDWTKKRKAEFHYDSIKLFKSFLLSAYHRAISQTLDKRDKKVLREILVAEINNRDEQIILAKKLKIVAYCYSGQKEAIKQMKNYLKEGNVKPA